MRLWWTFLAGLQFALLVLAINAPLLGGLALAARLARGELWTTLSDQSFFAVRDDHGRLTGKMANVTYRLMNVAQPNEGRPRRLLIRLQVNTNEFASADGDGRVRLDSWIMDSPTDLRRPPLYSVVVPGREASLDNEGMMMVERGGGRRSAFSLGDGSWLFDADTPIAMFAIDAEHRRYAALAQSDDDMPPGTFAVLALSTPQHPIRRLLIGVSDPVRARFLRGSIPMTRPVARMEDIHNRVLEVPMPAGTLRIPVSGDDLDLGAALIPQGFKVTELKQWAHLKPAP